MREPHWKICNAPICADDQNPNYKKEVIWYPSELVCGKKPFQKFQRKQALINRYAAKGMFKYTHHYWTAEMLEKRTRVFNAKGVNPNL